jgi:7,8-dihydropterin-6-yl-methyl-4-(beta-D-ribofuranosyl)aminobenzene 5'-phosphate synthase
MKLTIVYDNEVKKKELKPGWGFSCLIETKSASILFDTGADSPTLLHNMRELDIDPKNIGTIVISHAHGDHTGGLSGILKLKKMLRFTFQTHLGEFPRERQPGLKRLSRFKSAYFRSEL